MSRHEILNNVDHKDLRIDTRHAQFPGNRVMGMLAIPSEFRDLQDEYPIVFYQDETSGKFMPMALFGLERDENLYMTDSGWGASYIPLMIQRGPLLIGFQESGSGETRQKSKVISIDVEDSRVGTTTGELLFQPFGGNSEYTEHMVLALQRIDEGQTDIERLGEVMDQHALIEPFSLDVQLDNGSKHKLTGFYTVHEERLAALEGEVLAALSRGGILQAAYMMIASLSNLRRLIAMKNAQS